MIVTCSDNGKQRAPKFYFVWHGDVNETSAYSVNMLVDVMCHAGYGVNGGLEKLGKFHCGVDTPITCDGKSVIL